MCQLWIIEVCLLPPSQYFKDRHSCKCIGVLLNIYESVDVLTLIKGGSYEELNLSVGEALLKRPDVSFRPSFF